MVKGPKLLNPADKARKEARKKELKKNKKQRQQVRSAAIESRNPEQILAELEQLDRQEYDAENPRKEQQQPSTTTTTTTASNVVTSIDLLYTEKRKRLKELFARCLAHYEKEDPDRHTKLKTLEADYETKHRNIKKEFEAVKAATEVSIDDVFLPPEPTEAPEDEIADDDPLMSDTIYITPLTDGIKPPGCPPGPPPDLKQLVDSLKVPALMPSATTHQMLPPHLLNRFNRGHLAGSKRPRGPHLSHKAGAHTQEHQRKRGPHMQTNDMRQQQQQQQAPLGKSGKPATTSAGDSSAKSAVIESKPVIFMPKATKFLPASVRSKVQSKQPVKDDTSS